MVYLIYFLMDLTLLTIIHNIFVTKSICRNDCNLRAVINFINKEINLITNIIILFYTEMISK